MNETNPQLTGRLREIYEVGISYGQWLNQCLLADSGNYYLVRETFSRNKEFSLEGLETKEIARDKKGSLVFCQLFGKSQKAEYSQVLLLDPHRGLFEIELTVTSNSPIAIASTVYHPYWLTDSGKSFFRDRGIDSGSYYCSRLNQSVLEYVIRPTYYSTFAEAFMSDGDYYDGYKENTDAGPVLTYEATKGQFVLNCNFKAKLDDSLEDLVGQISRIMLYIFSKVARYRYRIGDENFESFGSFMANIFATSESPNTARDIDDHCLEPFGVNEPDYPWVIPDAIRITVQRPHIDPSFGQVTDSSWTNYELFEMRDNWLKTDFAEIQPRAYLNRLYKQARENPEESS